MAKRSRKRKGPSISGYFRELIEANPQLLNGPNTNAQLLERYQSAHPSAKITGSIKANLANVKSNLRKRKRHLAGFKSSPRIVGAQAVQAFVGARGMEGLEEYIDECLTIAKTLDREGLDHVIRLLRTARNEVVWKQGK
jgi:hypothetical protein